MSSRYDYISGFLVFRLGSEFQTITVSFAVNWDSFYLYGETAEANQTDFQN